MRTPSQRGRVGNWLRDQRMARGWTTQTKARKYLALAGVPVAASVYAEWESGTRLPSDPILEKLVAFYGPMTEPPAVDADDLIAALRAQTEAINALIRRLDSLAPEAIRLGVADALREAGLGPDGGGSQPSQPPGPSQ